MPAPRGRRKGGGGIRKRADPNRQRLARVVRSGEAREAKLARRIAALRASAGKSAPAVHADERLPAEKRDNAGQHLSSDEEPERCAEAADAAYGTLLSLLAPPAASAAPPAASAPRRKRPRTLAAAEGKSGAASASAAPAPAAGDADATAAAREAAHFGLSSAPARDAVAQPVRSAGTVGGVGRVSASFSPALPDALATDIGALALQPSVDARWRAAWGAALDPLCGALACALREFRDVVLTRRVPIAQEAALRRLYVVHAVAHVLRCRARVARHDAALRVSKAAKEADAAHNVEPKRDQGFARPRVLFLVPMRNVAYDIVNALLRLVVGVKDVDEESGTQVANRERFEEEFAPEEDDEVFDESAAEARDGAVEPAKGPYARGAGKKPKDFRYTFRGNIDDDFKFGISLSRKLVRLYSDFYNSDIIIASPLGLRRSLAAKAAGYKGPGKPKKSGDDDDDGEWKSGLSADGARKREAEDDDDGFLSSIEVCVLDGAHVFEMQNWDTLLTTMQRVNNIPASTRDTDFSRVREWALDGLMCRFRQTVVLSAHRSAPLMALSRTLENHAGRLCITEPASKNGSQTAVATSLRQTFVKVADVATPADVPEKRIAHFETSTLPLIRAFVDARTVVVVPSYFDFVRVRNLLLRTQEEDPDFTFVSMCEYSRPKDVARARARFFNRQVPVAVLTERFHFFWRHWIRGVNTVVWYGLPQNAHFYPEFLNMTREMADAGSTAQSVALYDAFDPLPLERIVGHARCKHMIAKDSKSTFMFVS